MEMAPNLWLFGGGLLLGLVLGLVLGPIVRSWLAWREWEDASRETRLTDEIVKRLEADLPEDPGTRVRSPVRRSETRHGWPARS